MICYRSRTPEEQRNLEKAFEESRGFRFLMYGFIFVLIILFVFILWFGFSQAAIDKIVGQYVVDSGTQALTNGNMEDWTSATDLTDWVEDIGGTSTINQETSGCYEGSNCSRHDVDASNSKATLQSGLFAPTASTDYSVSFYYKTDSTKTIKAYWWARDGGVVYYMQSDGSWTTDVNPFASGLTNTSWTKFQINTTIPAGIDNTGRFEIRNDTATSGSIYFDRLRVLAH